MTTYNGQRFLKQQLDSILAQSRPVDELVVCDDGSTDDTVDILNEFASGAPFPVKTFVNEQNLGSTKNFEKAISLCGGDTVILCDQDDVWLPDKVKILENIFLTNPNCGMAFTDAVIVDEMNRPLGKLWENYGFDKKRQESVKEGKGFKSFVRGNVVTGATAAVTKSFFEETAPFPEKVIHDYWMAAVAVLKGKLFFNDAITINYRKHASQQIGTTPFVKTFSQRFNRVYDFNKNAYLSRTLCEELNGRFHLTEKQNKIFAECVEFYLFRDNIARSGLSRLPKIAFNLFLGNYHKFASGFLSACKDLTVKR
jgi:glycosyltransferase involved in cell wall biosynthesis